MGPCVSLFKEKNVTSGSLELPTRLVTPTFLRKMSHRERGYEVMSSYLTAITTDGKRNYWLLTPTSGGRAE